MNFGELKEFARMYVPGAKTNRISEANLGMLINEGVVDVCSHVVPIRANEKFNTEDGVWEYDLTSSVTRFLCMDDS